MRIIARSTLKRFVQSRAGYPDQAALSKSLDAWFAAARKARWTSSADVKREFRAASIVSAERVVFNIKGNDYRLIVAMDFEKAIVWIKWIGTHRDYDRIDARTVSYEEP